MPGIQIQIFGVDNETVTLEKSPNQDSGSHVRVSTATSTTDSSAETVIKVDTDQKVNQLVPNTVQVDEGDSTSDKTGNESVQDKPEVKSLTTKTSVTKPEDSSKKNVQRSTKDNCDPAKPVRTEAPSGATNCLTCCIGIGHHDDAVLFSDNAEKYGVSDGKMSDWMTNGNMSNDCEENSGKKVKSKDVCGNFGCEGNITGNGGCVGKGAKKKVNRPVHLSHVQPMPPGVFTSKDKHKQVESWLATVPQPIISLENDSISDSIDGDLRGVGKSQSLHVLSARVVEPTNMGTDNSRNGAPVIAFECKKVTEADFNPSNNVPEICTSLNSVASTGSHNSSERHPSAPEAKNTFSDLEQNGASDTSAICVGTETERREGDGNPSVKMSQICSLPNEVTTADMNRGRKNRRADAINKIREKSCPNIRHKNSDDDVHLATCVPERLRKSTGEREDVRAVKNASKTHGLLTLDLKRAEENGRLVFYFRSPDRPRSLSPNYRLASSANRRSPGSDVSRKSSDVTCDVNSRKSSAQSSLLFSPSPNERLRSGVSALRDIYKEQYEVYSGRPWSHT